MTFFNREFSQGSQLDKIKRQLILYNCHDILQLQLKMKTIFTLFNVASMYYVRYPLRKEFCCLFDWSLQSINRDYYNFSLNRQSCHLKMASWNASWLIEKIQIVITFFLLLNGIKKDAYERIFYVTSLILVLTTTK